MSSAVPSYFINPWPPFPCINTTAIVAFARHQKSFQCHWNATRAWCRRWSDFYAKFLKFNNEEIHKWWFGAKAKWPVSTFPNCMYFGLIEIKWIHILVTLCPLGLLKILNAEPTIQVKTTNVETLVVEQREEAVLALLLYTWALELHKSPWRGFIWLLRMKSWSQLGLVVVKRLIKNIFIATLLLEVAYHCGSPSCRGVMTWGRGW